MATIKSYTDISQSKKLAEILPLESADMTYFACVKDWRGNPVEPKWGKPTTLKKEELALPCSNFQQYAYLSCWSLAALLEILPKFITKYVESERCQKTFHLNFFRSYYHCISYSFTPSVNDDNTLYCIGRDNWVDACVDMIIRLHELNLL